MASGKSKSGLLELPESLEPEEDDEEVLGTKSQMILPTLRGDPPKKLLRRLLVDESLRECKGMDGVRRGDGDRNRDGAGCKTGGRVIPVRGGIIISLSNTKRKKSNRDGLEAKIWEVRHNFQARWTLGRQGTKIHEVGCALCRRREM